MKTLLLLALATAAPAACQLGAPDRTEDGRLRNISPAALAALPPGVDPMFLIRGADGCYGIAIEDSDPPQGVALLDAAGNPVCDT